MARPKTKGDPITFRPSLATFEMISARATKAGQTPSEWVAVEMEKWAARQTDTRGVRAAYLRRSEVDANFKRKAKE
jgi:hypothetical protein